MKFSQISVLIPTRHRVARLCVLLESYRRTTFGNVELVFRTDEDDAVTPNFLFKQSGNIRVITGPRLDGYDSMPVFFNEMAAVAHGDVLMCGNDDMVFKTVGWPALILEVANHYPDGLFDLGVRTHNEEHYPFATVSRRVVEHLGFLWDPRIFWGDIYLRDVMGYFGRTIMIPTVEVEHDWAGWKPDRVFVEADKDIVRRNPTYWSSVHLPAVNEAVQRLQELHA